MNKNKLKYKKPEIKEITPEIEVGAQCGACHNTSAPVPI